VYFEHGGHVLRRRQPLPWPDLPVRDVPPDLGCYLLMQVECIVAVKLDKKHGDKQSITIMPRLDTRDDMLLALAEETQVVIREARRRQRRRQRWIAIIILVALIGIGAGLGLSFGTRAPVTRAPHRSTASSVPPPLSSTTATLNRPEALAIAPDGNLLIANQGTNQILERTSDGALRVIAGTGKAGYSADGVPATEAELNTPGGMAVAPDGTIYVADTGNNRVRAISPSGTITTVAGNGQFGIGPSGRPAVDAKLAHPLALALSPKGQLYVADSSGIQMVSADGILTTVTTAASSVVESLPTAIAVDGAGNLYVADFSPKQLVELSPEGKVLHVWTTYVTEAGLAVGPEGSVLVADYGRFAIDRSSDNQLTPITTFSLNSLSGLSGIFRPSGIAVDSAGQVYFDTDGVNGGTDQPALAAMSAQGQVHLLPTATTADR
jgi:sugar lactone lactonase YvrE